MTGILSKKHLPNILACNIHLYQKGRQKIYTRRKLFLRQANDWNYLIINKNYNFGAARTPPVEVIWRDQRANQHRRWRDRGTGGRTKWNEKYFGVYSSSRKGKQIRINHCLGWQGSLCIIIFTVNDFEINILNKQTHGC